MKILIQTNHNTNHKIIYKARKEMIEMSLLKKVFIIVICSIFVFSTLSFYVKVFRKVNVNNQHRPLDNYRLLTGLRRYI